MKTLIPAAAMLALVWAGPVSANEPDGHEASEASNVEEMKAKDQAGYDWSGDESKSARDAGILSQQEQAAQDERFGAEETYGAGDELPATAGPLPLIALGGLGSLALGAGLRRRNRRS